MSSDPPDADSTAQKHSKDLYWHTFEEILSRLHQEGILVHPQQLAEFFIQHGLPVDLRYVPAHLQLRAAQINDNYRGDMVRLEEFEEPPWYSYLL